MRDTSQQSTLRPTYLRCEYYVGPIGIDVPKPRLSWILKPEPPEARGKIQTAYRILVADSAEALGQDDGNLWDSGRVDSNRTNQIEYAGKGLETHQACFWKVQVWDESGNESEWSETAGWTMGLVGLEEWTAPHIGYEATPEFTVEPVPGQVRKDADLPPPPYLRGTFSVEKPLRRAIVHPLCWGLYKLFINGVRVGDDEFTPGWSDHPRRCYYDSYDVTSLVGAGKNGMGAILGDGWFAGYVGGGRKEHEYKEEPRLSLQLFLEYADGTTEVVTTGEDWKATYGPILESDLQMGEAYDARRDLGDWTGPDYDDSGWDAVKVFPPLGDKISAYPGIHCRKIEEIVPVNRTQPEPGVFVFDLGQNMVGWVRLRVKGKAGTAIQLRFAEVLNQDGTVYTTNLRAARCVDRYTLKGGKEEVWEPSFTFHGFRYVEVTGYPKRPPLDALTGIVVHAEAPLTSSFACSNPMLDRLFLNIVWGQRGNFLEVPTDCPQRDERLGWTGDAQIFMRTAAYNMDVAAFFRKWLVDLFDTQSDEGALADVAPNGKGKKDSPAWTDAGVICPYFIFKVYGDTRIVEEHYEGMRRYMDFVVKGCGEDLVRPAMGYGDWVSLGCHTPKDLIATAYLVRIARMMAEMAGATGRQEDAERFGELARDVRTAFQKKFIGKKGDLEGDTQTAYALGFALDLIPEDLRDEALLHFLRQLQYRAWHLSTGFVGTPDLLPGLTKAGKTDVAYHLLTSESFPSWGFQVKHGATTMWERWDSWTEEFGFQTPSMNSFNHYAFGAVGGWMIGEILGIETEGQGFREIRIRPRPGGGLSSARGSYNSIAGRIEVDWKLTGEVLTLKVEVPANTSATIHVPTSNADAVREGGRPPSASPGLEFAGVEEGAVLFRAGSGRYEFTSGYRQGG